MDPIQGSNAILSFFTNAWTPFVCTSSIGITIEADSIPIRTKGDGFWKKTDYQSLGFSISLGGVMVFNDPNFRIPDLIANQMTITRLPFRIAFTDDLGAIKSLQGTCLIKSSSLTAEVGQVVKGTFTLEGIGKLDMFDGLIPCATTINDITVSGTSSVDGSVTVTYDYTGDLYQVVYQVDGVGNWIYAQGATAIKLTGLSIGQHTIEINPICTNSYQGTGLSQTFTVTQNQTCNTTISGITVNLTNMTAVANVSTGTATQMQYSIDGGNPVVVPITQVVSLKSLYPGPHSITMTPLCSINGSLLPGTGATQAFTVVSQAAQALINYNFSAGSFPNNTFGNVQFSIYVNGNLQITDGDSDAGSFYVAAGALIRVAISAQLRNNTGVQQRVLIAQTVADTTLGTTLSNLSSDTTQPALTFTFTTVGDTYSITQSVNFTG